MTVVSGYAWVIAMRSSILNKSQRNLTRGAAVLLIGGLATGCSSSVARFTGVDDIFTSSTNQRQIIQAGQPGLSGRPDRASRHLHRHQPQPAGVSSGPVGRYALACRWLQPRPRVLRRSRHWQPVADTAAAAAAQASLPPSSRGRRSAKMPRDGRAPAAARLPPRKARPYTICRDASACRPMLS